ncbi:MAG: type ISP restriction/modification enzyme [Pirellulaceae bacterium]
MSHDMLASLSSLTGQLHRALMASPTASLFSRAWRAEAMRNVEHLGMAGNDGLMHSVAQAITCGCFGLRCFHDQLQGTPAFSWLIDGSGPFVREILLLCGGGESAAGRHPAAVLDATRRIAHVLDRDGANSVRRELPAAATFADAVVYFYERFLAAHDRTTRRRKGVFYTPPALVSFILRRVDRILENEFLLERGLADDATWRQTLDGLGGCCTSKEVPGDASFVRLLDPAMGTGAFLLQAAAVIRERFRRQAVPRGSTPEMENQLWNGYVARTLLPRLWGQELMLPSLVLAKLAMVAWLAETGFQFQSPGGLHFYLANTLRQPRVGPDSQTAPVPFTVIVGNPPFAGVSDNQQVWMRELLRGKSPEPPFNVANYFLSQGAPLRERKHWLEDDYVKFMRFAHWQIEKAGMGIIGFVTNHGYLDNSTFRGMREQLLETFPRISVVDLRGSTRNRGGRRAGASDQSVFGIEQGVAVGFFRRPAVGNHESSVEHAELWGDRSAKLKTLEHPTPEALVWKKIEPRSPHYFLVPRNQRVLREYEAAPRLCDVMPVNSTAVVTARDSFVVAMDRTELRERMRAFADPRISDEEIRARFFTNTRSRKYPPGDTRGWQVTGARRRMHADPALEEYSRPCLYRPFDQRHLFWAPWMIDWPRSTVMDPLASGGNVALIARRQSPPALPCNYFWISDTIVVDGAVRSDNRGSESVFPLYVFDSRVVDKTVLAEPGESSSDSSMLPNFSREFVQACTSKLGMPWQAEATGSSGPILTPAALLYYIYALFHCPSYRDRFAESLCIDFPRVLVPRNRDLFLALSRLGRVLANAHLLAYTRHKGSGLFFQRAGERIPPPLSESVEPGYPKYSGQTVWLNKSTGITPVARETWMFHVGSYQVCHKWLKDRRHRILSKSDLHRYRLILEAIEQTIQTTARIEQEIERHGSWENAFRE